MGEKRATSTSLLPAGRLLSNGSHRRGKKAERGRESDPPDLGPSRRRHGRQDGVGCGGVRWGGWLCGFPPHTHTPLDTNTTLHSGHCTTLLLLRGWMQPRGPNPFARPPSNSRLPWPLSLKVVAIPFSSKKTPTTWFAITIAVAIVAHGFAAGVWRNGRWSMHLQPLLSEPQDPAHRILRPCTFTFARLPEPAARW